MTRLSYDRVKKEFEMAQEKEVWKIAAIGSWGGKRYEISNHGRIRKDGKIKIIKPDCNGYLQLCYTFVHRLVAKAFLEPCFDDFVVHHKDGKKGNNVVSNLVCVTKEENSRLAGELQSCAYRRE